MEHKADKIEHETNRINGIRKTVQTTSNVEQKTMKTEQIAKIIEHGIHGQPYEIFEQKTSNMEDRIKG